jgi:hypothetical protein
MRFTLNFNSLPLLFLFLFAACGIDSVRLQGSADLEKKIIEPTLPTEKITLSFSSDIAELRQIQTNEPDAAIVQNREIIMMPAYSYYSTSGELMMSGNPFPIDYYFMRYQTNSGTLKWYVTMTAYSKSQDLFIQHHIELPLSQKYKFELGSQLIEIEGKVEALP